MICFDSFPPPTHYSLINFSCLLCFSIDKGLKILLTYPFIIKKINEKNLFKVIRDYRTKKEDNIHNYIYRYIDNNREDKLLQEATA